MGLSLRRRGTSHKNQIDKNNLSIRDPDAEISIPSNFRCPISLDLMKDPVTLSTGITYDRDSVQTWIDSGNTICPVTKNPLAPSDRQPVSNNTVRKMIQIWCVDHRWIGIERVRTARVPLTANDVSEVRAEIEDATQRADDATCLELVGRIVDLAKESGRNKKCLHQNGIVFSLSTCFDRFASCSIEKYVRLLGTILSAITWMLPNEPEGYAKLGSDASIRCIVWFLNNGDSKQRQNAAFGLKELLCFEQSRGRALAETEETIQGFIKLLRNPVSQSSTKFSLIAIFYMISLPEIKESIVLRFIEAGLISVLAETIIDAEQGICEKALSVLDAISESKTGARELNKNALIVPILVKKILRVSDLATSFAVSIMWKMYKSDQDGGEDVLVGGLQVGAFQKLLVVLQIGCEESTKEKGSELLRKMNRHRNKLEASCSFDTSLGLEHVKRAF